MMVGVGFGHGIAYEDEHHDQLNLTLVSWAMAAVFGSLALIRYNSSRLTRVPSLDRSMLTLLAGAVASALLALSHLGTLSLHLATAAVTVVAALIIATDPASQRLGKVEEAVLDEHGSEE
ncbi:hypothetical protein [Deinococcus radiophilus]